MMCFQSVAVRRWAVATFICAVIGGAGPLACARRTVTRVTPDTTVDLSGRWNDTDSREVSTAMIQDALNAPWITQWIQKAGRKPTVIVGVIRNLTAEHIPVGTFVGDIERAMVNSGQMSVVATAAERQDLRSERADQWQNATEETAKKMGRELGADFMLGGSIEAITDRQDGQAALFYQVDLTLVNIESNEKSWIGQHKIKKVVQKGRYTP
jgi:penicillin-binding protein activator